MNEVALQPTERNGNRFTRQETNKKRRRHTQRGPAKRTALRTESADIDLRFKNIRTAIDASRRDLQT